MMNGIGKTPLIKLKHLAGPDCADIYVKLESCNPTGSMKDRMALSMIERAEERGNLKPGDRVVEYTGGSTGSSLAMVCAAKGYAAHFVSSNAFAEEKLRTMRAFGARLELVHSAGGKLTAEVIDRMIKRAETLASEDGTFWTNQIQNPDNKAGYHELGREVFEVLGAEIDEFVMAVGGGGCISGTSEFLKSKVPQMKTVAVEPLHVRNISGGETGGKHQLEGIGLSFMPPILRLDLIDRVIPVSDQDAFETARLLARKEGIFGGATSGANVWAALQRAKEIGPGKVILTVIVDSGLKYLNGALFDDSIL